MPERWACPLGTNISFLGQPSAGCAPTPLQGPQAERSFPLERDGLSGAVSPQGDILSYEL